MFFRVFVGGVGETINDFPPRPPHHHVARKFVLQKRKTMRYLRVRHKGSVLRPFCSVGSFSFITVIPFTLDSKDSMDLPTSSVERSSQITTTKICRPIYQAFETIYLFILPIFLPNNSFICISLYFHSL